MRDKSEKKPVTKSVRLTADELQTIQKREKASGMKESDYIRHKLTDNINTTTPQKQVALQNMINMAYTVLIKAGVSEEEIKEFERECGNIGSD